MTRLRLAIFSTPSQLERLEAAVGCRLSGFRECWPEVVLELHRHRAPSHLLGHQLMVAELLSDRHRRVEAAGCSLDLDEAVSALCGELVERTAQVRFRPHLRASATEAELRRRGADVFDTTAYIGTPLFPGSWPYPAFAPDVTCEWIGAEDLLTHRPVLVPAALVVASTRRPAALCEVTSVGSASGTTRSDATEHAVRELLERDALRFAWFSGQRFAASEPPELWAELEETDRALGWATRFFHAQALGGRPLWVVLTRHREHSIFAIGSCCSDSAVAGTRHALAEALMGRLLGWLRRATPWASPSVRTFSDHTHYYSRPQLIEHVAELFSDAPATPPAEGDAPPWTAVEALRGAARISVLDLPGIAVTSVVAPGLQGTEANHAAARLGERTVDFSREHTIRTTPHPFA